MPDYVISSTLTVSLVLLGWL